jgi:predicted nucleic acid-binding protein
MKVFCDTNVLIAACITNHPHYAAARPVVEKVKAGTDEGFIASHSIAETYAVFTRLPGAAQVPPAVAWQLISENIVSCFTAISLSKKEYQECVEEASRQNVKGGMICDALLLSAAIKSGASRIYTFNVAHFHSLALKNFPTQIVSP